MTESHAEQLDPTVLGERVGDDTRPADGYPADEPMAVDDPAILPDGAIARDDVATRDERIAGDGQGTDIDAAPGLIETGDDADVDDTEPQLIADPGDDDRSPEAAAVHVADGS